MLILRQMRIKKKHFVKYWKIYSKIDRLYGFRLFFRQFLTFSFGWILCSLMGMLLPTYSQIYLIRLYDDRLLWQLMNSIPTFILSVRIINIGVTFAYDTLSEYQKEQKTNEIEYVIANIFKKNEVEKAFDMLQASELDGASRESVSTGLVNVMALNAAIQYFFIIYAPELINFMLGEEYQDKSLKIVACLSIVNCIFAYKSGQWLQRFAFGSIYLFSFLGTLVCEIILLICYLLNFEIGMILCLFALSAILGVGVYSFAFGIQYYMSFNDSVYSGTLYIRYLFILVSCIIMQFSPQTNIRNQRFTSPIVVIAIAVSVGILSMQQLKKKLLQEDKVQEVECLEDDNDI